MWKLLSAIAMCVSVSTPSYADEITDVGGNSYFGRIVEISNEFIRFEPGCKGKALRYRWSRIERIEISLDCGARQAEGAGGEACEDENGNELEEVQKEGIWTFAHGLKYGDFYLLSVDHIYGYNNGKIRFRELLTGKILEDEAIKYAIIPTDSYCPA